MHIIYTKTALRRRHLPPPGRILPRHGRRLGAAHRHAPPAGCYVLHPGTARGFLAFLVWKWWCGGGCLVWFGGWASEALAHTHTHTHTHTYQFRPLKTTTHPLNQQHPTAAGPHPRAHSGDPRLRLPPRPPIRRCCCRCERGRAGAAAPPPADTGAARAGADATAATAAVPGAALALRAGKSGQAGLRVQGETKNKKSPTGPHTC